MKPLASAAFMESVAGNAGWNDLLGNQALADARRTAQAGVAIAVLSGAACIMQKNLFFRAAAAGVGAGRFLVAAKQAKDGLAFRKTAARLKQAQALRPEPVLPKPPLGNTLATRR